MVPESLFGQEGMDVPRAEVLQRVQHVPGAERDPAGLGPAGMALAHPGPLPACRTGARIQTHPCPAASPQ